MRTITMRLALVAMALMLLLAACGPAPTPTAAPTEAPTTQAPTEAPTAAPTEAPTQEPFTFGILLVGAHNDNGWSQAHYDAGLYVEQKIPGSKMLYLENVYSGSPSYPGQTASQLAEQLVSQGAKLVIFNSDDMKDEALKFAKAHPEIYVIGSSDDWTWKDGKNYQDSPNQVDIMGRVEYMKMIGGCSAALTTKTGKIGYLGPLINFETRRLTASAYLGARYCYENYREKDPAELKFTVTWIGFWFNIPGVTSDPTADMNQFFDSGADVVLSGIDTTEAIVVAGQRAEKGEKVFAIPYDYVGACDVAPEVCLGVPFFNWGPAYLKIVQDIQAGTWEQSFVWLGPDWAEMTNKDTSNVGWVDGPALTDDMKANLDDFISKLADGSVNVWTGPINLQDGTEYVADGVEATDPQIWYLPQLLEGMTGASE